MFDNKTFLGATNEEITKCITCHHNLCNDPDRYRPKLLHFHVRNCRKMYLKLSNRINKCYELYLAF